MQGGPDRRFQPERIGGLEPCPTGRRVAVFKARGAACTDHGATKPLLFLAKLPSKRADIEAVGRPQIREEGTEYGFVRDGSRLAAPRATEKFARAPSRRRRA